jgi:hypothetical protein
MPKPKPPVQIHRVRVTTEFYVATYDEEGIVGVLTEAVSDALDEASFEMKTEVVGSYVLAHEDPDHRPWIAPEVEADGEPDRTLAEWFDVLKLRAQVHAPTEPPPAQPEETAERDGLPIIEKGTFPIRLRCPDHPHEQVVWHGSGKAVWHGSGKAVCTRCFKVYPICRNAIHNGLVCVLPGKHAGLPHMTAFGGTWEDPALTKPEEGG